MFDSAPWNQSLAPAVAKVATSVGVCVQIPAATMRPPTPKANGMSEHDPKTVAALDQLEAKVAQLQLENPDEDAFRNAFAGEADVIEDNAPLQDAEYVRGRIDCMLKNAGAIPGEEEGEPCK